ncbi:MAG: hypothetical protein AAFP86_05115, partial [Planctomycetota bacterium]
AGPDSTEAYRWLLASAEAHRPGFRARFFDFLVQRLNKNKLRYPESFEVLRREIQGLAGEVEVARASRRSTYEYARLALILKQEQMLRESYKKLCTRKAAGPPAEQRAQVRRWLVSDVAPVLGRFGEYRELLMGVGDSATEYFERRLAALERAERARAVAAGEEPAPEDAEPVYDADHEALPHAAPDSVKDSVTDASWVFEALLGTDRDEEARALFELMRTKAPGTATYAEFAIAAIRREEFEIAAEVLDVGEGETQEKGKKRLTRIRRRLAAAIERKAKEAAEAAAGDGGK